MKRSAFTPPECPEIEDMDASDFCKEVTQKKEEVLDWADTIGRAMFPGLSLAETIVSGLQSTAETNLQVFNKVRQQINDTTITSQLNSCDAVNKGIALNIISADQTKCLTRFIELGLSARDASRLAGRIVIRDVNQGNSSTLISACSIYSAIDVLTQIDATVESIAVQQAIAEAEGLMSSATVDQLTCNDISNQVNACTWASQEQACLSNFVQEQENAIKAGCGDILIENINQTNVSDTLNDCSLSAVTAITTDIISAVRVSTDQYAKASASGLTMGFLILIFVIFAIIFVGIIIIPKVFAVVVVKNIFKYIVIISMIVSIIFFILYFVQSANTYKIGKNDRDSTFICEDNDNNISLDQNGVNIKFKNIDLNQKKNEDSNTRGYVFLYNEELNKDVPKNEIAGLLFWVYNSNNTLTRCTSGFGSVMNTIEHIETRRNPIFLIIALACLGLGILMFIYNLLQKNTNKNTNKK